MQQQDALSHFYKALGDRLRVAREKQLTQQALAFKVNLKRTSITNIEKGRQRILLHTLLQIAEALNLEPCELLDGLPPVTLGGVEEPELQQLARLAPKHRTWINATIRKAQKKENR